MCNTHKRVQNTIHTLHAATDKSYVREEVHLGETRCYPRSSTLSKKYTICMVAITSNAHSFVTWMPAQLSVIQGKAVWVSYECPSFAVLSTDRTGANKPQTIIWTADIAMMGMVKWWTFTVHVKSNTLARLLCFADYVYQRRAHTHPNELSCVHIQQRGRFAKSANLVTTQTIT